MIVFSSIVDLERQIRELADAYYNGEAKISDAEFDGAVAHLRMIHPKSLVLKQIGAPVKATNKIKHINSMGSLDKVFDTKWLVGRKNVIVMPKLDGISIEVVYEQGEAVQASSRGDGTYGEDLLGHVKKTKQYRMPAKFTGVLYGEFVMLQSVFNAKYSKDFANPRNLVAGISHRIDTDGATDCEIVFYGGDYFEIFKDKELATFKICPFIAIKHIHDKTEDYSPSVVQEWTDYPTDGLVWWDLDTNEKVAYKFPAEKKEVIVKEIEWNLSKVGNMIPVLIFDPVQLAGTQVSRCTCNNASWIINRKIVVGSVIIIQKANEIIPNLVDVKTKGNTIAIPSLCPVCNYLLEYKGVHLTCNNPNCTSKSLNSLKVFFEAIGMKDFGDAWFNQLYEAGYDNYMKVWRMSLADYLKLGITEYSANKFINRMRECWRKCSPVEFLAGLNVTGASNSTFKFITDYYKLNKSNFLNIRNLSVTDLQKVPRIGVIAEVLIKEIPQKLIYVNDELCSQYEEEIPVSDDLKGKSFCFTGKLDTMKRVEAENMVKMLGGTVGSVTSKLTYLVTNDTSSGSSKNQAAVKLGIKVITEKEFLTLVNK